MGISDSMDGTWSELPGGRIELKMPDEAMAKYQEVIAKYPGYPFSYAAMARALQLRKNPKWREHAERGVEILERTTSLSEHHGSHDEVLIQLRSMLSEKANP